LIRKLKYFAGYFLLLSNVVFTLVSSLVFFSFFIPKIQCLIHQVLFFTKYKNNKIKEAFILTVKVSCIGLKGLEGYRVQVEVQISPGMDSMVIVGLPDASVRESKERVLSAIRSLDSKVGTKGQVPCPTQWKALWRV
jgi:hypothetical protein